MLRHLFITAAIAISALIAPNHAQAQQETEKAKVYFTSDISPESLVKIYHALGKEATGKVAVKISTGDNSAPLVQRINSRHGAHTVEYAAEIGLGTLAYDLVDITNTGGVEGVAVEGVHKYNVYDINGVKVLTNADALDSLTPGVYIVNGVKTLIESK